MLVPDPDAPPTDVRFKAWLANVFCTGKAWPGIEVCRTEQQREPERQERDWVYRANTGRALPPKKCKETKKVSVVHGGASPDMTAWLPVKCETKQEWTIKEDIEKLFSEWDGTMEMREETEGHAPFNEDIKCSSPYIKTETKEEYD